MSLFFRISLLLPYPPKQPFWQLQAVLFSQAGSATQSTGRASCLHPPALKYSHRRHGQRSQMTPKRRFPSPEGHKAASPAPGLGCAAGSSLLPLQISINPLESPVCAQSLLAGDQPEVPSIKGNLRSMVDHNHIILWLRIPNKLQSHRIFSCSWPQRRK